VDFESFDAGLGEGEWICGGLGGFFETYLIKFGFNLGWDELELPVNQG
jgi:hypothetical protein